MFQDENGVSLLSCSAIPSGWETSAYMIQSNQSAAWPVTFNGVCKRPQIGAVFAGRTGAGYVDIVSNSARRHIDGQIDQATFTQMRRFTSLEEITDSCAREMLSSVPEAKPVFIESRESASKMDFDGAKQSIFDKRAAMFKTLTAAGLEANIEYALCGGVTRLHRFTRGGNAWIQATCAVIDALRWNVAVAGLSQVAPGQKTTTAVQVDWNIEKLFYYQAREARFERYYDDFESFCTTLAMTEAAEKLMDEARRVMQKRIEENNRRTAQQEREKIAEAMKKAKEALEGLKGLARDDGEQ